MHILPLLLTLALTSTALGLPADQLWQSWPEDRFVRTPAPCLGPAELTAELQKLSALYPEGIHVDEEGQSVQGRPIHLVTLGHGPRTVLLWSQMHGDEPSATPALLDIAHFLLSNPDEPEAAAILEGLTLLMVPMLNPDGAEIYQRRNLQGIDINRDALHLATPEGRILKRIRDEHEPMLGFNLHDQSRRMTVGDTGVLATNAVLAVAGDEEGTLTPGRLRAQRACAAIVEVLAPFMPGGMARFDEDWNPRAFGDNITAWGTPVVLIESGGVPPGHDLEDLTRINFVAILTVLRDLVRDDLASYDPEAYTSLPRNRRNGMADVVVRGCFIRQPGHAPAYRADLAFDIGANDRAVAGCAHNSAGRSRIVELGDAGFLGAGRVVDAGGGLLLPTFVAGVEGWSARRWLSADVLSDLAGLGVGTVLWELPRRKVDDAEFLAGSLIGEGRARLMVMPAPAKMPWLRLTGPPQRPASASLYDVVSALAGGRDYSDASSTDMVGLLTTNPLSHVSGPTLERGRPASFVLLSPATEGRIDIETVRLSSVFLDGRNVRGGSQ